jgi:hypothetical protein
MRFLPGRATLAVVVGAFILGGCGYSTSSPTTFPAVVRPGDRMSQGTASTKVAVDIGRPDASDEAAARTAVILYHHIYPKVSRRAHRSRFLSQYGPLEYWGGPVLSSVQSVPVFVNCANPINCFGNVEEFLTRLQHSNMIHIVDQYMEPNPITSKNRYQAGAPLSVQYSIPGPLPYQSSSGPNALAIAHRAALVEGAGFGHIYHILFPPGVHICDLPGDCEPDHYCADHGAVLFPDIGIVLVNLEASQVYVTGSGSCESRHYGSIPHTLIDATANALSHETFETITDPYAQLSYQPQYGPYAWLDATQTYEIGDLCEDDGLESPVNLNGKTYTIQAEYSNKLGACTYSP